MPRPSSQAADLIDRILHAAYVATSYDEEIFALSDEAIEVREPLGGAPLARSLLHRSRES